MLTFCILLSAVSAVDNTNVSITEYSNLDDDVNASSMQNKLEISNEDSISETNIVNSHDDNLEEYPSDTVLSSSIISDYEDNNGTYDSSLVIGEDDKLSLSSNEIIAFSDVDNVVSVSSHNSDVLGNSSKVSTKMSVGGTTYSKSGTVFKVTLKDNSSKALSNQKISLKVNGKTYSANTNKQGIASIKTAALSVGTYALSLTYAGNSYYAASSLSKKVKVSSSVKGSDIKKYYGYASVYQATFLKDGAALANTNVSFKLDGKSYTKTTNKNGVAKLKVKLSVGNHTINSVNPYSGEKLSNKIVVKKDKSNLTTSQDITYIPPKTKYAFIVVLKSRHDVNIKGGKVYFDFNGKTLTATTDKDGKAIIILPGLSKGKYDIKYSFRGNGNYYASSGSGKLYVREPTCNLTGSDLKMKYNDGSYFKVTLKKLNKPLSNKIVKFVLDNKTYTAKTNAKGVAKLAIGKLAPGNYTAKYYYGKRGTVDHARGSNNIFVSKLDSKVFAKNLNMKYKDGSSFKATLKDMSGKLLSKVGIKFKFNGKSYKSKTDTKGVANLKINAKVGYYPIVTVVYSKFYKSDKITKMILVNGTKFVAKKAYASVGKSVSYSVKVIDGKSKPVKKVKVTFTLNKKKYSAKTNDAGVAKVNLGKLSKGDYKIQFSVDSTSGSSTIHVLNMVTLNQIISASKYVKGYIEDNEKLPSKIKIGNLYYSTADFLYLVSEAIINLKSGSKDNLPVLKVASPKKPGSASYMGELYNYLDVAKSLVKTAKSNGIMPDYVSSSLGDIGYKGAVYALTRVVAFYGNEGIMPAYTVVKSLSESTTSKLNSKNTIKNLKPYLAATTNCQVNNAKIKNLVAKLTKGLTSEKAKAKAIFNYVRDTVSYSFYYDTRYGAVGTLNAGTGNCVDHAHLVVAMSRAAGLPARYVHGTCTFSSATYGHVWAQVLVGDTWTVADATSTRNSFGNVVNWNPDTYSLHGYYISLPF